MTDLTDRLVGELLEQDRRIEEDPLRRTTGKGRFYVGGKGRVVDVSKGSASVVRYLPRAILEEDDDGEPIPFLDDELARPWLRHIHRSQRPKTGMAAARIPWPKHALAWLELAPPAYFQAPATGEMAYVDVVAAYPSVYTKVGLDPVWAPDAAFPRLGLGRFSCLGARELAPVKGMHRAVGGILRATKARVVVDGRSEEVSTLGWSQFLAPACWGVVMSVMHAVASYAVESCGAYTWWVDGGCVPAGMAPRLAEFAASLGLEVAVKAAGLGSVSGVLSWRVGDETAQGGEGIPVRYLCPPSPAATGVLQTTLARLEVPQ